MSNRVVIRSDADNHVLFSLYKTYYTFVPTGPQTFRDHRHTELEISCILSGSGIYNCCGKDYPYAEGDIFFHCGNDIHYFRAINPGDESALLAIRFDPRFIWVPNGIWTSRQYIKLFSGADNLSRRIPASTAVAPLIRNLLDQMFEECREHVPEYELMVKSKLMMIFANLASHFHKELDAIDDNPTGHQHMEQMNQSMDYILSHLAEPLTLQDLAHEACMSRSYYSAIFKSLNGISVWEYIVMQRVNMAQYKLETTNDSVAKICGDCGFSGAANFNRAFKRLTGKTPREYRKTAAEPTNHSKEQAL